MTPSQVLMISVIVELVRLDQGIHSKASVHMGWSAARGSFFWRKGHDDQLGFGARLPRFESFGTALEIVMEGNFQRVRVAGEVYVTCLGEGAGLSLLP